MSDQVAEVSAKYLAEAAKNAVPVGYKQTEVGVIPEDWEVLSIDDTSIKVGSGKTPTGGSTVYVDCGRPFIRSQNVGWGKLELSDVALITDEIHQTFTGSEIQEHDVLLNITGASIGRCAKADERIVGGNVNQHVCIVRTDLKKLLPKLLVELVNSSIGQNQIDSYQAGGNREGLNFSQVRQLRFAVSKDEKEQTAIANALSDVDALISELEKLIAKKQAIKTATMQQLLTGRTRLPQFALREDGTPKATKPSELGEIPEDWEVSEIGDFAPLQRGFDLPSSNRVDGQYPVVYSNGIVNTHCHFQVKGPGVVTGRSGTLGKVHYVEDDYWPHNTSLWVTKFNGTDPKFIYFVFTFIGFERFASGSGVPTLNRNDAHSYKVLIPSTEAEQTAIATILSDMDAEIQALEQRLGKTRQIKQGMMQELLTGKTRLVKPSKEVVHE